MKITVFAKNSHNSEGKTFTSYSGRMVNRDGDVISMGIKFKQPCQGPRKEDCPCNIEFDRAAANLQTRYDEENDRTYKTLWIEKYTMGEEYIDHSLDDFDD